MSAGQKDSPARSPGRSLGSRLRRYDWVRRILPWRKSRDAMTVPPMRFSWRGVSGRILIITAVAITAASVLWWWLDRSRQALIDARIDSLTEQAQIVADVIASTAVETEKLAEDASPVLDRWIATDILLPAIAPTNTRGRVFDAQGKPFLDTRFLLTRNQIAKSELPLPADGAYALLQNWLEGAVRAVSWMAVMERLPLYNESTLANARDFEEAQAVLLGQPRGVTKRSNRDGRLIISVAVPVKKLVNVYGVLMLSTEAGELDDVVQAQRWTLLAGFLAAVVLTGLLSFFLGQQIADPIKRLSAAADRIRRGDADEREIPKLDGAPDEVRDLENSFREMTRALTSRIDKIETFAADVAHEIKNPLTSLRSALETLKRTLDPVRTQRLIQILNSDVERLDRLVSDISAGARWDSELARQRLEVVDLTSMLAGIAAFYENYDPPLPVRMSFAPWTGDSLFVEGKAAALSRVFTNILDNAISFSPASSEIAVTMERTDGWISIRIMDEGKGIPVEILDKIFERFVTHRTESKDFGSHSGLGLAISLDIVRKSGGNITAANRTDRSGAIFTVTLPLYGRSKS